MSLPLPLLRAAALDRRLAGLLGPAFLGSEFDEPNDYRPRLAGDATQGQRDLAAAEVAGWDWTRAAEDLDRRALARAEARSLAAGGEGREVLLRAVLRLIRGVFAQQRAWDSQVRAQLQALGRDPGAPPAVRTFDELVQAALALVDQGQADPPPAAPPPP